MLNTIREHADSWLIKSILWLIVFAFLGTIFYSWGMGGTPGSTSGVVATVNGSRITQVEYERTFDNLMNFYRDQFKNQFSEELLQKLDLKTQALDVLIQKKILMIKANELRIGVSDTEVINRIQSFPAFQKNEVYDHATYQNFLKFKRLTPLEFEESQRETLLLEKIENLIKSNIKISANELDDAYKLKNQKVKLDFIKIPNDYFKTSEKVAFEEIKSFYEKNNIQFEIPEKIKAEYIQILPSSYEDKIDIQSEDIEDYYKMKIADFNVQKMYKASHILFRLEPQIDNSVKSIKNAEKEAKKEAESILNKIKTGADFGEMAKKYSDDPNSGKNGGSLGEFPKGMMVSEFESALEKLKPGEISQPIQTSFGFHLIRLEEVKTKRIKPLKEVKEEITQKLKEIKTRQKMRRVAKHIYRSAKEDQDLARAAQENQQAVKYTPFISRESHLVPEIGTNPDFFNQVFLLEDNRVGDPIHTMKSSFVLKVIAREKAYIPALTDVEELVKEKAQEEKNLSFSANKSSEIGKKLSAGKIELESLAKELGLDLKQTPFFNRADSIPGIGNLKKVKIKAFELGAGKSGWVSSRNSYYMIRSQGQKEIGNPDKNELKNLTVQLKLEKGNSVFQEWLKNLKDSSEVLIDKTRL